MGRPSVTPGTGSNNARAHGDAAERDHGGREGGPRTAEVGMMTSLVLSLTRIEEGLDQRRPHPALEPGFDAAVASFEEQAQRQRTGRRGRRQGGECPQAGLA